MSVNLNTIDGTLIEVGKNDPPEFSWIWLTVPYDISADASAILLKFVAPIALEVIGLQIASTTQTSGTLKGDVLVAGVSIMSTKATQTVADTPVAGVFSSTRIAQSAVVKVILTADSATFSVGGVAGLYGTLFLRPLLGSERSTPSV